VTWSEKKLAARMRRKHEVFCVHCKTEKRADEMEPLYLSKESDRTKAVYAGPSDCCKRCWREFLDRNPWFGAIPSNIEKIGGPVAA
jgi:hypothetical protein